MNPKIMQLLRFTEEDLALNRKGKMSEKQRKRQMNSAKLLLIVLVALALLFYGSFFLVNEGPVELFRHIMIAVVCSLFALSGAFYYWKTEKSVTKEVAKKITGTYSVTVKTQPFAQTCSVSNASGTATANVTNITISCVDLATQIQGFRQNRKLTLLQIPYSVSENQHILSPRASCKSL